MWYLNLIWIYLVSNNTISSISLHYFASLNEYVYNASSTILLRFFQAFLLQDQINHFLSLPKRTKKFHVCAKIVEIFYTFGYLLWERSYRLSLNTYFDEKQSSRWRIIINLKLLCNTFCLKMCRSTILLFYSKNWRWKVSISLVDSNLFVIYISWIWKRELMYVWKLVPEF